MGTSQMFYYQLVKRSFFFLHWRLTSFVGNQLTINLRIQSWTFNSSLLLYTSVLVLRPHYLTDRGFMVSFEIG